MCTDEGDLEVALCGSILLVDAVFSAMDASEYSREREPLGAVSARKGRIMINQG